MNLKAINKVLTEATIDSLRAAIDNLKKENRELKEENQRLLGIIESLTKKE